jgi:hypothetical protein
MQYKLRHMNDSLKVDILVYIKIYIYLLTDHSIRIIIWGMRQSKYKANAHV